MIKKFSLEFPEGEIQFEDVYKILEKVSLDELDFYERPWGGYKIMPIGGAKMMLLANFECF